MGRLARKGKRLRPPSLRSGNRGRLFQPATMLRTSTRHLHGCANLEPYVAQVMPIVWPAIGKSGLDAVTAAYAVRPAMLVGLLQCAGGIRNGPFLTQLVRSNPPTPAPFRP